MQLLPIHLPEGMTLTHLSFAMIPWFAPSYSGVVGATAARPSEPTVAVTYEWPITWLSSPEKIPKAARETLSVRRFSADQAWQLESTLFPMCGQVLNPNDAPDTIVTTDQGDLGVESTSLTLEVACLQLRS